MLPKASSAPAGIKVRLSELLSWCTDSYLVPKTISCLSWGIMCHGYQCPPLPLSSLPVDSLLDLQSGQAGGTVTLSLPSTFFSPHPNCILVFQKPLTLGYGEGIFLGSAERNLVGNKESVSSSLAEN